MAFLGGLCLSFFLLFLTHSTLLFYLVEEIKGSTIPAQKIIFPRPRQGRGASSFSLGAALVFLLLSATIYPTEKLDRGHINSVFPLIFIFTIFPACFYLIYLGRRVRLNPETNQLMFLATQAERWEIMLPVVSAIALNMISRMF